MAVARLRSGDLVPLSDGTPPRAYEVSPEMTLQRRIRRPAAGYGNAVPTPIWGPGRRDAERTTVLCHDVFRTGEQTMGPGMTSMTDMVPSWQCGHTRRDTPVSASWLSR